MRECGVLQVRVHLLDDGVLMANFVGAEGIDLVGVGGGEVRVEPPDVAQRALALAWTLGGRRSGMWRITNRPGWWSFFREAKAVNFDLRDLRPRDSGAGALVVDGVGVLNRRPRALVVANGGDRTFDRGGQAHGHRDIGAGAERSTDRGMAVKGGIAADQNLRRAVAAGSCSVGRSRSTVAKASEIIRAAAPHGEPQAPRRRRRVRITGAQVCVVTVAMRALSPRTPE